MIANGRAATVPICSRKQREGGREEGDTRDGYGHTLGELCFSFIS